MKNIILLSLFILGCIGTNKQSWQGTYYPDGCLDCESKYIYSPTFNNYNECKEWADSKLKSKFDKVSCGSNCSYDNNLQALNCDLVVRSWHIDMLPNSPTFVNYKE